MFSVLIIEDELPNATRLEKMLLAVEKDIRVVGHIQTVSDSLRWLKEHDHPDLICMDIRLTDGLSFELFDQMPIRSHTIFITAYDEYALRAFQVNGIDYLLKPIEASQLEAAIRKVFNRMDSSVNSGLLDILRKIQLRENVFRSRFLVSFRDLYIPVLAGEIAYFGSENKNTFITTHLAQRYIIEQTLEELEQELNPHEFFRISRQYIVSIKSIRKVQQSFNGKLQVELLPAIKESVLVSRDRSSTLKKWLNGR